MNLAGFNRICEALVGEIIGTGMQISLYAGHAHDSKRIFSTIWPHKKMRRSYLWKVNGVTTLRLLPKAFLSKRNEGLYKPREVKP
jgi:hypothetical protein